MVPGYRHPVDAFLDDLGTTPVPPGLARAVVDGLGTQRRATTPRRPLILALAAVLVAVAALAAVLAVAAPPLLVPPPTSPILSLDPSPVSPAPSPTASSSASPTSSPAPSPAFSAPITGSWDLLVPPRPDEFPDLRLRVLDRSGLVVDARLAGDRALVDAPEPLTVRPDSADRRSVVIGWGLLGCVERAQLEIATDGQSLELRYPQTPGCDSIGPIYAITLVFRDPVEASTLGGPITGNLLSPEDLIPHSLAFVDSDQGWAGGTTADGDAVVIGTDSGGATWRVWGFLSGDMTALTAAGPGRAVAAKTCPDVPGRCRPTISFLRDGEDFQQAFLGAAVALDFTGAVGLGVFADEAHRVIRLTDDAGDTWTDVAAPCTGGEELVDAERTSALRMLVLCAGEPAGAQFPNTLYLSYDRGQTWTEVADTPPVGGLPPSGDAIDFAGENEGWMWGPRSRLLSTMDGGRTWQPLDVVDGPVRTVIDASYLGGGAGLILVWDPDRAATLLLETTDGVTWSERRSWASPEARGDAELVVALRTRPPEPSGAGCPAALAMGQLVRDDRYGIGLQTGQSSYTVIWPHGYSGRVDGGRLALVDSTGRVLAHVGDVVQMGGGGLQAGNAWHACGDVEVVEGGG